ncbi:GNAT family N-acetyltransferase [Alkalihalobacillus sp. 1P02AB]|uniref:GNAT family N-acetyltransferase n=1 Tax=Alkalihalobacillus sp. 1P02AB TaxID=3132260 RepID=UPI0039A4F4A6
MNLSFSQLESLPTEKESTQLIRLHEKIFAQKSNFIGKLRQQSNILIHLAYNNNQLVGYKIGYELTEEKFYSWLGGVDPHYRNYGIASTLMKMQHDLLIEYGYQIVQTKTMNKWRNMLILNIKNGFDVLETYTDKKGMHKIILEKKLIK